MDVQLLRGIIMYKRKKNQPLHQQTQLLFAAIPFGSGDKIQEACPFWTYKRFGCIKPFKRFVMKRDLSFWK